MTGRIAMTNLTADIMKMVEILPSDDQQFAYEFVKKLVLAWDPDFTKVTLDEAQRLKLAEASGFVDEEEIDWDKIGV